MIVRDLHASGIEVMVWKSDKEVIMKLLKWTILGVGIWGLSLIWPEINLMLSLPVSLGLIGMSLVGLLAVAVLTLLERQLEQATTRYQPLLAPAQASHAQPTRPMLREVICNPSSRPTRPMAV
jgi:hypothetical protein